MSVNNPSESPISKEPAYDLRQIYAELLGGIIVVATESADKDDYQGWLKKMDLWHMTLAHTFKKTDIEQYNNILKDISTCIGTSPAVFNGQGVSKDREASLRFALKKFHMFLMKKTDDAKLLGARIERDPSKIMGQGGV